MKTKLRWLAVIILVAEIVWLGFWLWPKIRPVPESKQYISEYFAKDGNLLPSVRDVNTFSLLPSEGTKPSGYSKDKNGVYFYSTISGQEMTIPNADRKTFRLFPKDLPKGSEWLSDYLYNYAYDKNQVYFRGQEITGADPLTFVRINNGVYKYVYGKDKNGIYYENQLIPNADLQTFEVLWRQVYEGCSDGHYARDKQRVYFEASIVLEADPETFEPRLNGYGLDQNNVYLNGEIVPGMLPADFVEPVCNYG